MANLVNGFWIVNIGNAPNDGTGDSFRDSFNYENINWSKLGNSGLANTTLSFDNSGVIRGQNRTIDGNGNVITTAQNLSFSVDSSNGARIVLGSAGTSTNAGAGNINILGGTQGQFLRAADNLGNIYFSGGAVGVAGAIQYSTGGADPGFRSDGVFTYISGTLRAPSIVTTDNLTVGGIFSSDEIVSQDIAISGNAIVTGNLVIFGNTTTANAQTVDIGSSLINVASNANSYVVLENAGIAWANGSLGSLLTRPHILWRSVTPAAATQATDGLLDVFPGIFTNRMLVGNSFSEAIAAGPLAAGQVVFGQDVQVTFENTTQPAEFATANINQLYANTLSVPVELDTSYLVITNALPIDSTFDSTRILKIRSSNTSATTSVGLQLSTANGATVNGSWDMLARGSNGALTFGYLNGTTTTGTSLGRWTMTRFGDLMAQHSANLLVGACVSSETQGVRVHSAGPLDVFGTSYVRLENTEPVSYVSINVGDIAEERAVFTYTGFTGIGETNPVSKLHIKGNTDVKASALRIARDNGTVSGVYSLGIDDENNKFFIADNRLPAPNDNIRRLVINGNGNVGLQSCTAPQFSVDSGGAGRFRTEGGIDSRALILQANSAQNVDQIYADTAGANIWSWSYRPSTNNGDLWLFDYSINRSVLTANRITGNIGINQNQPAANLHVASGTAGIDSAIRVDSTGGSSQELRSRQLFSQLGTLNSTPFALQTNLSNAVVIDTAQRVGVGLDNNGGLLDTNSRLSVSGSITQRGNAGVDLNYRIQNGAGTEVFRETVTLSTSATTPNWDTFRNNVTNQRLDGATGFYYFGTTPPATMPQRLTVGGNIQLNETSSSIRFGTAATPSVRIESDSNYLDLITNGTANVRVTAGGDLGVGTVVPAAGIHLERGTNTAEIRATGSPAQVVLDAGATYTLRSGGGGEFAINNNVRDVFSIDGGNSRVLINPTNSAAQDGAFAVIGRSVFQGHVLPQANATYDLGSSTNQWNSLWGYNFRAKYADLAEIYSADAEYPAGTAVIFGGKEEVTISNSFGDSRVAGVISTNPAYIMNSTLDGVAVALRGRVPALVEGAVRKGDLLVTGNTPGHLTSVGSHSEYGVAIVAKSLEDSDIVGSKTVEVVII